MVRMAAVLSEKVAAISMLERALTADFTKMVEDQKHFPDTCTIKKLKYKPKKENSSFIGIW